MIALTVGDGLTAEAPQASGSPATLNGKIKESAQRCKKKIIRVRFIPRCLRLIVVFLKMIEFSDGLPI